MRIALVRHGQTNWNLAGRLQGTTDIDLNDTGRAQASEAAMLLSDQQWDLVVSSTLSRARETATIIATTLEVPLGEADASLIERAYGEVEGFTKEEAVERFGDEWPGEEAYDALQERAVAAVNAIADRHEGQNLIIVTHGTFIRAFADVVTGTTTQTPQNAHSVRWERAENVWKAQSGLLLAADAG